MKLRLVHGGSRSALHRIHSTKEEEHNKSDAHTLKQRRKFHSHILPTPCLQRRQVYITHAKNQRNKPQATPFNEDLMEIR